MSWQLKILRVFLRRVARRSLARQPDSVSARKWFERGAWLNARGRPHTGFTPDSLGGVPALWTARPDPGAPVILYLHGGGYVMGNPRTHAALGAYLKRKTGLEVCLPDYRLAPEHPFPAAFEDARTAWRALIAQGHAPGRIVLCGDSAGGGLALALLGHLCATGQPRPGLRCRLFALHRSGVGRFFYHAECAQRNPAADHPAGTIARPGAARRRPARSAHLAALQHFLGRAAGADPGRPHRNPAFRFDPNGATPARTRGYGNASGNGKSAACLAVFPRLAARGAQVPDRRGELHARAGCSIPISRKLIASAMCGACTVSAPSRSAIVRATRSRR